MNLSIVLFIASALGIILGYGIRYIHSRFQAESIELTLEKKLIATEERAHKIIEKAEEKAERLAAETKQRLSEQSEKLEKTEGRLIKKEELLDNRQIDIDSEVENVRSKIEQVRALKDALAVRETTLDTKLEEVAGLTKDEALERLNQKIEREYTHDIDARIKKLELFGAEKYEEKARGILTAAIHRIGNTLRPDIMTSSIELPSEDMKGKIIGKEGRNIRAFEFASGVDVLVDETPGHITLSSFDPVRREIARVAMVKLIEDGRIQPAKIEELLEKARSEVAEIVKAMGEKACYEAGVTNLHPDLVKIVGRLHFRTSYGQNVLWHSVEMSHIAAIIAEEVGADVAISRAGALLHDIGKTVSQEVAGTHVEIGIRILKKYNVDERVILAMRAHHEEYPYETPESMIVQVADAISGGRPGARRDSLENYIKRIGEIENIAKEMPGVDRAFAIQAGREVRVLVNPSKISDHEARNLAQKIAKQIEEKLRYPGEIKVHVIRETRTVEYAR